MPVSTIPPDILGIPEAGHEQRLFPMNLGQIQTPSLERLHQQVVEE